MDSLTTQVVRFKPATAIIKENNSLLFKSICLKFNSLKSGLGQGFTVQGFKLEI